MAPFLDRVLTISYLILVMPRVKHKAFEKDNAPKPWYKRPWVLIPGGIALLIILSKLLEKIITRVVFPY